MLAMRDFIELCVLIELIILLEVEREGKLQVATSNYRDDDDDYYFSFRALQLVGYKAPITIRCNNNGQTWANNGQTASGLHTLGTGDPG